MSLTTRLAGLTLRKREPASVPRSTHRDYGARGSRVDTPASVQLAEQECHPFVLLMGSRVPVEEGRADL